MKCHYHHKQKFFLDYFDNPIPDDAVIYVNDITFQCNEKEGRCAEFIGNLTGTIFVATERDHGFLLSQKSNAPYITSNSSNFGQLCVTENCNNLT